MKSAPQYFSRYVRAGLYKMHYVEWGDGTPVVMIHGGGPGAAGEFGWRNNIPAISRHGRAIAIDQIGFGLSDKPLDREYNHQFLVEQFARFIDALCLDEIYIVGNSLGAYVAARYALDHPGRVKKMLLVSSGTVGTGMGIESGMTPRAGMTEGMKSLVSYDGTKEGLRRFIQGIMYHPENFDDEKLAKRFEYAELPGVKEAQASFMNFFQKRRLEDPEAAQWFDIRHRLPKLTIPLLFIWGSHDIFALPAVAEQMQTMLPNATFEFFKESGHLVQNDEPEHFNRVAVKFFFGVDEA